MSDVGERTEVEIALERSRIETDIMQLRLKIKQGEFRLLQMESEKRRILENDEATLRAIAELEEQLATLDGIGKGG